MHRAFKLFLSFAAILISFVNTQCALACSLQKLPSGQAAMQEARHACCPQERAPKKSQSPCTRSVPEIEMIAVERAAQPALFHIVHAAYPVPCIGARLATRSSDAPMSSSPGRLTPSPPRSGVVLRI